MKTDILQQFSQVNRGDILGNIWATKNIDPELNEQKVNVSKVMGYRTDSDDEANLGIASAFAYTSAFATDGYYAVAGGRVWETGDTDPNAAWSEVSGTPTDCDVNSDIIAFNGKIYVATQNFLKSYTPGAGFVNVNALSSAPHSMTIFANRLYVTDNSENIESMNTAETYVTSGSNTMDLGTLTGRNQLITKIASVSNGIWIATIFTDTDGGEMILWDGETENTATARYKLTRGALSMVIKNDRPYIVDSLGRLRVFDGTSFIEIARLPIKDEDLWEFNDNGNGRFIHPNGMLEVGEEIYILVSNRMNDTTQDIIENLPSGVWAWNQKHGLYHKYSFSHTELAQSGNATPKDFGVNELVETGALYPAVATGGTIVDRDNSADFLAGVRFYSDATNSKYAIALNNVDKTVQSGGYFVTTELQASDFDEQWKEVIAVHDKLKNSTDRIIVKYRTDEDDPIYGTGTWSNDLRITTNTDVSTLEQGDEIEILRGNGSGMCYTIDRIDGTFIYFKENPLSTMSGTVRFLGQKWKEVGVQKETDVQFIRRTLDAKSSAWIQFKVMLIGTGKSPQVSKLISVSENKTGLK